MTATLCFIDTETTSLRPDRRAWEIGIIRREGGIVADTEHHWFIHETFLDLGNADLMSLKIGGYFERHPEADMMRGDFTAVGVESEPFVLREVERVTRGAHLIGNVVSFDAEVLANRMRANGICPSWHYHLVDIESMAIGWLDGRFAADPTGLWLAETHRSVWELPWDSEKLSAALGVDPPSDEERHTALGDAQWVMRMWDTITGGPG